MAIEVVIPMLGITIERGKITKWLKAEGDFVKKGEPIFEVETEKVVTEVESPGTGILKKILVSEGIEVPVLTIVAIITEKGEEIPEKYREVKLEILSLSEARDSQQPRTRSLPPPSVGRPEGFDIAILGAGPGGYVAAIRAAQMGARVLLVEKDELGGTCVNRGCIPTKSYLSDIKTYKRVKSSDLFLNGSKVTIDLKKMIFRKNQVVETAKKGISLLLDSQKITVLKGVGSFYNSKKIRVSSHGKGHAKGQVYEAQNFIIATGSQVTSLPGIKIDGNRILSSDDVVNLKNVPEDILIIGGGVIGVEFATIFNWLGARVTVLEMLPQIVSSEDEEVIRGLKLLLERQGVKILTNAKVLKVSPKKAKMEIIMDIEGKEERISGEKVLMAVGRVPNIDGLNLDQIGIQKEGKFIKANSKMETNIVGIYAIGDLIGKMMLAHAASAEGIVAVENILGRVHEIDYQKIPSCIYTFPEVASVGLKESEAKQKGYDTQVGKFSYLNNGKALAMGETEGFVKIVAEKELGQILGVHILGEHATDLIGECLLAMNVEASIEDLGGVVKGHPTLSEALMEAALDCQGLSIHKLRKSN